MNFFSVTVHGLQRDHLTVQGTQYYYPATFWDGKSVMGKKYEAKEAVELLYDLGNKSQIMINTDNVGVTS